MDGSRDSVVTPTSGENLEPAWTPDGSQLLFISDRSGTRDLWAVPIVDGKAAGSPALVKKEIGQANNAGVTQSGSYVYNIRANVDFFSIADMGSGHSSQEVVGFRPTWSKDGKTAAFTKQRPGGGYEVAVHSIETGEEVVYPFKSPVLPSPPAWFHDGSGFIVVAVADSNSPGSFYRVDLKTREFRQLFEIDPVSRFAPGLFALSGDDKTLYFGGRSEPRGNVDRMIAVDLASKKQSIIVTLAPRSSMTAFAFSPDGRTIALKTDQSAGETPNPSRWGPDSSVAMVGSDGTGYREIFTDSRGALPGLFGLTWAKDGRSILFGRRSNADTWQIVRLAAAGGKPESTGVEVPGPVTSVDLTADGSRIAVGSTRATQELWSLDNVLPAIH